MALASMSGTGRLTGDPELRFAPSGMAVATVNLAFNARRLNKDTQEWEDGDVFFVRGTAFKQLAENIAETLAKGVEVHVSGRLKTEQWEDKNGGGKRSATALIIESIGPNLAFATASVNKVRRDNAGAPTSAADPYAQPGGAVADDDSPPF